MRYSLVQLGDVVALHSPYGGEVLLADVRRVTGTLGATHR
jgi:hypothetical protein